MNITDKIKKWEDACEVLSIDPIKSLPYPTPADQDEIAVNAFFKLTKIREVLNEGWKPDWKDSSEWKYYPWMDLEDDNGSGLGLSFGVYVYGISASTVGSRLVFKSRSIAEYAGKQFTDIYAELMVIKD